MTVAMIMEAVIIVPRARRRGSMSHPKARARASGMEARRSLAILSGPVVRLHDLADSHHLAPFG